MFHKSLSSFCFGLVLERKIIIKNLKQLCSVSLGGLRVGEANGSLFFPPDWNPPFPTPPRGASRARWPSTRARLELVPFFFKGWQPWFFVVMCNTVCTVCRKEENTRKKKKRSLDLYCRIIFIASIVIHKNHFLLCIYLLYLLEPSSSDVAFVLRNFHYF